MKLANKMRLCGSTQGLYHTCTVNRKQNFQPLVEDFGHFAQTLAFPYQLDSQDALLLDTSLFR